MLVHGPLHSAATADASSAPRRTLAALVVALTLFFFGGDAAQPAYAYSANCINVVLRDPYWRQFRGIVQSGGNAGNIGYAFARRGFRVDNVPVVGAIVVWPSGYGGAGGAGHVGIVAAVYGTGSILVRHENWPYGTGEHVQTFPALRGLQFVHPAYAPRPPAAVRPASTTAQMSAATQIGATTQANADSVSDATGASSDGHEDQ